MEVFSSTLNRSSHWRCSIEKAFLKNFAIFTEKHLCWSLFLIKFQVSSPNTVKYMKSWILNHFLPLAATDDFGNSHPKVFLLKGVLKICNKFTGEHPCKSVKCNLLCNFIEISLWHGCSPVNLLHVFRTPFCKNTSGWLLLWLRNT